MKEPMVLVIDTERRIDYKKIFDYYGIDLQHLDRVKEEDLKNAIKNILHAKLISTVNKELTDVTAEMVKVYRYKYFDKYKAYWSSIGINSEDEIEYAHDCYSKWIQRVREWRWSMKLLRKIKDIYYPQYPIRWKPRKTTTWEDVLQYVSVVNAEEDVVNIIKATIVSEQRIQKEKAKRIIPNSCNGVFSSELKLKDLIGIDNKIEY